MKISVLIIGFILNGWAVVSPAMAEKNASNDLSPGFQLQAADDSEVTLADYRGNYVLLAFGFTHCEHICPMIAANIARALKATDEDAVGIFISVDSERDTPAITAAYASRFGESMVGLSGSYSQLAMAARSFKATFVVTKSQDSYTVQHTPSIFLLGPNGMLIDSFAMNTPIDTIVAAMR